MSKKQLILSNDNLINPKLIQGVIKFPGKGVMLRNEYNKILDFIRETDERKQAIIVKILYEVISSPDWEQPDWATEFETAP